MSKSATHDPLAWIKQGRRERSAPKRKPKAKAKAKDKPQGGKAGKPIK